MPCNKWMTGKYLMRYGHLENNDGIADADYEYAKTLEKNLKEKVYVIIMTFMFRVIYDFSQIYLKILEINALKYI